MTYEIFITPRKVPHLVRNLGKSVEILDQPDETKVAVRITVENEFDVLHLIHAGEEAGMELFTNPKIQ